MAQIGKEISVSTAARLARCSPDTVLRWIEEGAIAARRTSPRGWWKLDLYAFGHRVVHTFLHEAAMLVLHVLHVVSGWRRLLLRLLRAGGEDRSRVFGCLSSARASVFGARSEQEAKEALQNIVTGLQDIVTPTPKYRDRH